MKKARLTEEQIIGILQEHEAGAKCADLCRKHGMLACCRFRGHEDKIVTMELESGYDETEVQPRVQV